MYLDEVYAYFFQKALVDAQFIKERKDKLKETIQQAVKTAAITAVGIVETAAGVYLTAIDFMLTIFSESERDILYKQLSEYNATIGWEGKLIRLIIYEDNRYMSTSDIRNEERKTEVSWYSKSNKPSDTYIVYGEKYMWGKLEVLRNKPMDKLKESVNNFKMGIKDMEDIIKVYDF